MGSEKDSCLSTSGQPHTGLDWGHWLQVLIGQIIKYLFCPISTFDLFLSRRPAVTGFGGAGKKIEKAGVEILDWKENWGRILRVELAICLVRLPNQLAFGSQAGTLPTICPAWFWPHSCAQQDIELLLLIFSPVVNISNATIQYQYIVMQLQYQYMLQFDHFHYLFTIFIIINKRIEKTISSIIIVLSFSIVNLHHSQQQQHH